MKIPFVESGVAARALAGESDSGDRCLVHPLPDGAVLAVVDGLGHGPEAAHAADIVVRVVERLAEAPPHAILAECRENLRGTRGATLSLARWYARSRELTWFGVGDVAGVLLRARSGPGGACDYLLRRTGVVGGAQNSLRMRTLAVPEEGVLILATDGITSGYEWTIDPREPPAALADKILARFSKDADDALVLVARLLGEPG